MVGMTSVEIIRPAPSGESYINYFSAIQTTLKQDIYKLFKSETNLHFIETLFNVKNVASRIPSALSSGKTPIKPGGFFTFHRV